MSIAYHELLNATIEHLQALKHDGRHFIAVELATLEALTSPAPVEGSPSTLLSAPTEANLSASHAPGLFSVAKGTLPVSPPASPLPIAHRPPPIEQTPAQFVPTMDLLKSGEGTGSSSVPRLAPEEKLEAITHLRKRVLACVECKHLAAARRNVVFGVGDVNARLMFVGEAPGADEDAQGEPFVGAAGKLLTKIIETMGLSRQTVYIGNILKCRPDTPGKAFGNRKPTSAEMKTCLHWLEDQIDIIQPEVLVALGATAVEGLLGSCPGISKMRGHWHSYRNIPLMPTFHPSFLLRSTNLADKRKVWEDMLQVMTKLGMPISEKQQNYYLKSLNARNSQ